MVPVGCEVHDCKYCEKELAMILEINRCTLS